MRATNLRESAIVPDITMMGEAIADVSKSSSPGVLFDGIKRLFFGDFHLCIRPAGYFDDHI